MFSTNSFRNLAYPFFFFFGYAGTSLLRASFLWLQWAGATLCCSGWVSHCGGFSCCGAQALAAQALVVAACGLSNWGSWALVALWHVEVSQTRDWTQVSCIGRWIIIHYTTREVPLVLRCVHSPFVAVQREKLSLITKWWEKNWQKNIK